MTAERETDEILAALDREVTAALDPRSPERFALGVHVVPDPDGPPVEDPTDAAFYLWQTASFSTLRRFSDHYPELHRSFIERNRR